MLSCLLFSGFLLANSLYDKVEWIKTVSEDGIFSLV
jgi:hypothetical protein